MTASARGTAMQFWRSHCPREVNGLGELPVLKRIVKRQSARRGSAKTARNPLCERPASQLAKQKQDQQNNNYKPEATAPVVASTVKRAAANSTEAAQQCDDQNDGTMVQIDIQNLLFRSTQIAGSNASKNDDWNWNTKQNSTMTSSCVQFWINGR